MIYLNSEREKIIMSDIQKITRKVGVLITTVHHVINKTRYVSPKLTVKVVKVIKDLDCK